MKLHLPLSLRSSLLACLSLLAGMTTQAQADFQVSTDLGGTLFIGDSITNGHRTSNISWRWWLHRLFVDCGITYGQMGIMRGTSTSLDSLNSDMNVDVAYGDSIFRNVHAAQSGARSSHVVGKEQGKFGNTTVNQWLVPGSCNVDGITPVDGSAVNTVFVMLGTNDTMNGPNNTKVSWDAAKVNSMAEELRSNFEIILNAVQQANPNAKVIFTEIPTWYKWTEGANLENHLAGVAEINRQLSEWAGNQGDNVTMLSINTGLIDVASSIKGQGLSNMYTETDGTGLHPNDQASLIIAGNVAKALGYAGATAGQRRRAVSDFESNVLGGSASRTLSSGSSVSGTWLNTPENAFTVSFTLSGGIGDGATGGWNTSSSLAVSVGNGSRSGTLNINEAYIQWGNSVLYSLDTSTDLKDALRIAYVNGNARLGLASGFYVWLGDQLIGEGLGFELGGENGVTVTNNTGANVTLSELFMDSRGSWAPDSNGMHGNYTYIEPMNTDLSNPYIDNPGVLAWPVIEGQQEVVLSASNGSNISASFGDAKGAVVTGSSTAGIFLVGASNEAPADPNDAPDELYATLENVSAGNFSGVVGAAAVGSQIIYHGNVYMRLFGDAESKRSYGAWFGVVNADSTTSTAGGVQGNLYMEFSDPGLTVSGDAYGGSNSISVAGSWSGASVTGTLTMVFNAGTFQYMIFGGSARNGGTIGKTALYINGGTFNGNIIAGGLAGEVGNTSLTISGDDATFGSNVTFISSGAAGGRITGNSTLTIADVTDKSGISKYTGTLTGGDGNTTAGKKYLVFKNAQLGELKARLGQFNDISLEKGSKLSLSAFGGATSIAVDGTSELTLMQDTVTTGLNSISLYMGSKLVLESGVSLNLCSKGDAALNGGEITLKQGSSLTMSSEVEGRYSVNMQSGSNLDATALGTTGLTVTCSALIDDTTGSGSYTIAGEDKLNLTLKNFTAGSVLNLDSSATTLELSGDNCFILKANSLKNADSALLSSCSGIRLAQGATLKIDVMSIVDEVNGAQGAEVAYYLTKGDLSTLAGTGVMFDATLAVLGWTVEYGSDGALHFSALDLNNIYISKEENSGSEWGAGSNENIYESVGSYGAVLVNSSTGIDLRNEDVPAAYEEDGLMLRNLIGTDEDAELTITGSKGTKVTISNTLSKEQKDSLEAELNATIEDSLTFAGNITITDAELQIKHMDPTDVGKGKAESTTIVQGNLNLEGEGGLTMTSGVLRLEGEDNSLGSGDVRFAGNDGQIVVASNASLAVGGTLAVEKGVLDTKRTEHVLIEKDGELSLGDGAAVDSGVTIGNDDANQVGLVTVSDGTVKMARDSRLTHVSLQVDGTLEIGATVKKMAPYSADRAWDLAGLSGNGAISSTESKDMDFTVADGDHVFSGDLAEYQGTMSFGKSSYTQYFAGVKGGKDWNVTNKMGGNVVFDLASNGTTGTLVMGKLTMNAGSTTSILLDLGADNAPSGMNLQELEADTDANLTVGQYRGTATLSGKKGELVTLAVISVEGDDHDFDKVVEGLNLKLTGVRNAEDVFFNYSAKFKTLTLLTYIGDYSDYVSHARGKNAVAGAKMLWAQEKAYELGGDLAGLDETVYMMTRGGKNVALASKIMAAAAGSGTAVMGQAMHDDVDRQLNAIRNRASSFTWSDSAMSGVDVWLNGEGRYHKMDASDLLSGYKLNSWGGTVGAATGVGSNMGVGLAITAMYGDLESEGADRLKGDMDTYYVTAFFSASSAAWRHTVLATVGRAQMDVNRTVDYVNGHYTTKGHTDGTALGLMYEVGYTIPMSEDWSSMLQPIVNVSLRHTRLSGYGESGSTNATLCVGEQEQTSVTFGAGARVQSTVGGNLWNRTGIAEARVLGKARTGDRSSTAPVAFRHGQVSQQQVESASIGSVGVELGAGVSVPVSKTTDIFADASVELWSNYTNANATVGVKIGF